MRFAFMEASGDSGGLGQQVGRPDAGQRAEHGEAGIEDEPVTIDHHAEFQTIWRPPSGPRTSHPAGGRVFGHRDVEPRGGWVPAR